METSLIGAVALIVDVAGLILMFSSFVWLVTLLPSRTILPALRTFLFRASCDRRLERLLTPTDDVEPSFMVNWSLLLQRFKAFFFRVLLSASPVGLVAIALAVASLSSGSSATNVPAESRPLVLFIGLLITLMLLPALSVYYYFWLRASVAVAERSALLLERLADFVNQGSRATYDELKEIVDAANMLDFSVARFQQQGAFRSTNQGAGQRIIALRQRLNTAIQNLPIEPAAASARIRTCAVDAARLVSTVQWNSLDIGSKDNGDVPKRLPSAQLVGIVIIISIIAIALGVVCFFIAIGKFEQGSQVLIWLLGTVVTLVSTYFVTRKGSPFDGSGR